MSRLFLLLALAVSATGCETLKKTPQVDLAPAAPVRYVAAPAAAAVPTGSLFQAATYRPSFEDVRARLPGDTVTVQIEETVKAKQESDATVNRSADVQTGISALPFLKAPLLAQVAVGAKPSAEFKGNGDTKNENSFMGSITATVVEVLPNGHLVVTGEKQVGVNQNVDVLRFSGTVNPRHISAKNEVKSTQVADVRIESRGRGAQGEALAIGWLGRFFLNLSPF